jgi:hypothetical protein
MILDSRIVSVCLFDLKCGCFIWVLGISSGIGVFGSEVRGGE